jgi:anti-sigma B factor antagonist
VQDGCSVTLRVNGDGSASVRLAGEFDVSTADDLRECLVRREVLDATRIRVDMKRVTFLDASSLGVLVTACKRVRAGGGSFSVSCGWGTPLRVLEISGLVDYFDVAGVCSR